MNSKIADLLDLQNQEILSPKRDLLRKLVVMFLKKYAEELKESLFNVGAGKIGNYKIVLFKLMVREVFFH